MPRQVLASNNPNQEARSARDEAMLYKFKSKADADVMMTSDAADQVLQTLGREPAPQGIFEAAQLGRLIETLEAAVHAEAPQSKTDGSETHEDVAEKSELVSLRQRAWPLLEMMKRAKAEGVDIVWGV